MNYVEAIKTFNLCIELNPHNKYHYLRRIVLYFLIGKYEEAEKDLLNISFTDSIYFAYSALCNLYLKQYQEALEDISYAITEDDKEVYYAIRAKIYDTFEEDSVNAVLNLKIAGEKYWPEEFKSKVFINE